MVPGPGTPTSAEADRLTALAIDTLSTQTNVAKSQITVTRVEPVDWPDSSLGCPQPGMLYSQIVTPGYRIILSNGSQQYEFHTDRGNRVIPCQK